MKPLRSMLFVPADNDRKLEKGLTSGADAIILDLEDAVAPSRKKIAREAAATYIQTHSSATTPQLYVRINPLDSGLALLDLASVLVHGLAGILLPKTTSAADVIRLGYFLDALEVRAEMTAGHVSVIPVATETAPAMLNMGTFAGVIPRLSGITWGAEDLSAAIGAIANREENGQLSPLYEWAGSLCLCAAAAAGVPAIDTLYANYKDDSGLATSCAQSRRRGFRGRIAIHPAQVHTINKAFTPSQKEREHAQRIVDAFTAQPDAGTVGIDGLMYDIPHLKQARQTLQLAT